MNSHLWKKLSFSVILVALSWKSLRIWKIAQPVSKGYECLPAGTVVSWSASNSSDCHRWTHSSPTTLLDGTTRCHMESWPTDESQQHIKCLSIPCADVSRQLAMKICLLPEQLEDVVQWTYSKSELSTSLWDAGFRWLESKGWQWWKHLSVSVCELWAWFG